MKLRATLLLLAACAGWCHAAEPDPIPAAERKQIIEGLQKRAAERAELESRAVKRAAALEAMKAGVIDKSVKETTIPDVIDKKHPIRFPSKAARDKEIQQTADSLKQLQTFLAENPPKFAADYAQPLSLTTTKEVGPLPFPKVKVFAVIDQQSALIDTRTDPAEGGMNHAVTILVSGIDTSKYADGLRIDRPPGLFFVVGNRKIGTTTYLHLVPLALTDGEAKAILKAGKP